MAPAEPAEESLDEAACGLVLTGPDGTFLAVNRTFLDWSGYERSELVGRRTLDDLFTIPCRIYFETHYAPLLRLQGFLKEIASDIVCKDGRALPAFLSSVEKRDENGHVLLVRTAVFDATDRRKYERELLLERRTAEQAVKAKGDFLAMFAHELRNPLGAVLLQTHLLEQRALPPQHHASIARLRSSVDKVLNLVNNMLDVSKLEAGKVTLEETPFVLRDVVQAVVHSLEPSAERKGLPIRVELDEKLPMRVRGDPVKLDQALTNLVGNAIKFTERGSVTLGAQRTRASGEIEHVRFWVQDTGIGIPQDRQASVFDEYVQADPTVTRRFGGTGLGLAITRKLVELQGSKVDLKSEPGEGSTFSFELRLRVDRNPVPVAEGAPS